MVVKRNQPRLYQELTWYFDAPPLPWDPPWRWAHTLTKGHGRLDVRSVTCPADLAAVRVVEGIRSIPATNKLCGIT